MTHFLTLSLALASIPALAGNRPFDLYEPIVNHQIFGQPPADFDPAANPNVRADGAAGGGAEEIPLSEQQKAEEGAKRAIA